MYFVYDNVNGLYLNGKMKWDDFNHAERFESIGDARFKIALLEAESAATAVIVNDSGEIVPKELKEWREERKRDAL